MLIKATDFIVFEKSVFESNIENEIQEIIKEHRSSEKLTLNGLNPIKTVLFEGPPGVGKTYSAKWIAQSLGLPLYILDLASVMNSHLGKTGNNIKEVFQYISDKKCILLLDEFDAIAKKRDDASDVGELKRLVTVLLQALDHQSDSSLIIAATNHSELLDPAVWRRFEKKLSFGKPSDKAVLKYVNSLAVDTPLTEFSFLFKGMNFSDILHRIKRVQKLAVLNNTNVIDELLNTIAEDMKSMNILDRKKIGKALIKSGHSHREAAKRANLSRPTLIKYINENMDV
nr:ATP-binding protein [Shewanella sairae]